MVSRPSGAIANGTDLFRSELLPADGRPDCDRAGPVALRLPCVARDNISVARDIISVARDKISVAGAGSSARTVFVRTKEDPDRCSGRSTPFARS
jgi:hypothetical protein